MAVIELLHAHGQRPRAVFSNSDHLQTSCALVAEAFDCPGKDWLICHAAKNKAEMRERLQRLGLPGPWFQVLTPGMALPGNAPSRWWPSRARASPAWTCNCAATPPNWPPTARPSGSASRTARCCSRPTCRVRCSPWKPSATASACSPSAAST
ncbi:hypothetical protein ACE0DR_11515 [Azotobacter sp. CWF10]